jgi:hypothetical protein
MSLDTYAFLLGASPCVPSKGILISDTCRSFSFSWNRTSVWDIWYDSEHFECDSLTVCNRSTRAAGNTIRFAESLNSFQGNNKDSESRACSSRYVFHVSVNNPNAVRNLTKVLTSVWTVIKENKKKKMHKQCTRIFSQFIAPTCFGLCWLSSGCLLLQSAATQQYVHSSEIQLFTNVI